MTTTNDVSILSEDASLSGRVSAQDLTILGGFEGDVAVRGRLRIGPNARVKAKVKAASVEIEGNFEGEVRATTLTFAPAARARGLFLADKLGIREGAVVEGAFNLAIETDARPKPPARVQEPAVAVVAAAPMESPVVVTAIVPVADAPPQPAVTPVDNTVVVPPPRPTA
jgi:cytoskeletal protein CcmA (bactofilin family)